MQFATEPHADLVVCPLIGMMGHRETPLDSNYLAFRLASILSGTSIKLPCPCLRPPHLDLEALRPVKRANEKILPALITIKAGICTDLVISQKMAQYILDKKNEAELRLRPEDCMH